MSVLELASRVTDQKADNWEIRAHGLKKVAACPAEELTTDMKGPLRAMFESTLRDLRSNVVREACCAIKSLAQSDAAVMKPLARDILPTLSAVRGSGNKLNASYVHEATRQLIANVPLRSSVVHVIDLIKSSKSKEVRESAAEYLYIALSTGEKEHLERGKEQLVHLLQQAMPSLLALPSPRSREWARAVFWQFHRHWPQQAELARKQADGRAQKMLGTSPSAPPEADKIDLVSQQVVGINGKAVGTPTRIPQPKVSKKRRPLSRLAQPQQQTTQKTADEVVKAKVETDATDVLSSPSSATADNDDMQAMIQRIAALEAEVEEERRKSSAGASTDGEVSVDRVVELEAQLHEKEELISAKNAELEQQEECMKGRIAELEAEVEEEMA